MSMWYDFETPVILTRSFGELMDELFDLWLVDGTNKTFEEFIQTV